MRVRPAPGLKIRHPVSKELHDENDVIEVDGNDLFWARRLNEGDVLLDVELVAGAPAETK